MPLISPTDGPVAVTGVTGFTGGHMVRELVLHGYQVRACLRDGSSWRGADGMAYLKTLPNVEIVDGCDLFKPGSFDSAFKGCSAVFALAAVLGNSAAEQPSGSGEVFKDVYDGGMVGMQNVIDSVNKSGSVKRLIYTSSMAAVASASKGVKGHEWTEVDWASDGVDAKAWKHPSNAYTCSKVETEHMINRAAGDSGGKWDAVTLNPAMICGPILFKAQNGQWIENIGNLAGGVDLEKGFSPFDMNYDIIDVRDLVAAHRLAAESPVDHATTHGGARYLMHGSGGRGQLRVSTEVKDVIHKLFPSYVLGNPVMKTKSGKAVAVHNPGTISSCKKAKEVLGVTFRPVEETIRDVIETSVTLGLIRPKIASKL